MVIGALARDLNLETPAVRATRDIDVAVPTADVDDYRAITSRLPHQRSDALHRFRIDGVEVDVIPFGPIACRERVDFPGVTLDVMGLRAAWEASSQVEVGEGIAVRVASASALCCLKIIAWRDRHVDTPKDAIDLVALLDASSYGERLDMLEQDETGLLACDYVWHQAGAYRTGRLAREALDSDTISQRCDILAANLLRIVGDSGASTRWAEELLSAFLLGMGSDA